MTTANFNMKEVRDRLHHYLSPDVAADVGLSLAQLQQIVAGTYHPDNEQLKALARRIGLA